MKYPPELKLEAQRLYAAGVIVADIARHLGIRHELARRWAKPGAHQKVLAVNARVRRARRAERLATDPGFAERVAEKERMKNPEYRAQKKECQRLRQLTKSNTLEAKCRRALDLSRRRAERDGHKPCTAKVSTLIRHYGETCYICRLKRERLQVEHCHRTGRFRGWACNRCNVLLARYGDNLRQVRTHIREHPHKDSGYYGVTWDRRRRLWGVRIQVKGKRIRVGRFGNPHDAAIAYDVAALQYHKWPRLNFPRGEDRKAG